MADQVCLGSSGTGSPRALGPEEGLQVETLSSPPSAAAHSGLCVPPLLPPPLEIAGSSSADLTTTTTILLLDLLGHYCRWSWSCRTRGASGFGRTVCVCPTFRYCLSWDLEDLVEDFDLRHSVLRSQDAILPAELS